MSKPDLDYFDTPRRNFRALASRPKPRSNNLAGSVAGATLAATLRGKIVTINSRAHLHRMRLALNPRLVGAKQNLSPEPDSSSSDLADLQKSANNERVRLLDSEAGKARPPSPRARQLLQPTLQNPTSWARAR